MIGWLIVGGISLALLLYLALGYVKAPPDTAFIISGLRKRIIVGKAAFRLPFLERLDKLNLKLISVDVKTNSFVPTAEYINISVDAAVKIKIGTEDSMLAIAAENFLNRDEKYIIQQVQDVLEGNMREIIGQMQLEDMVTNRKTFAEKVQENAVPDLRRMGLDIISFNVQSFTDQNDVINDLGIDNISQIKKKAAIAKAEAEKEVAVREAYAKKEANDARVDADTQIAVRNNDLRIKEAELKLLADIKKAEADAAYKIQEEDQRKTIEVRTVDANIARQEREAVLKAKEVEVTEKTLEATINKRAEAELYERQKKAEADLYERQKRAEAELIEAQRQAEALKLQAQAERFAKEQRAEAERFAKEQEAEGVRKLGLADAEAIRAKGVAEAEGIDKKAEAMKKYGEAAVLEMYFNALPETKCQGLFNQKARPEPLFRFPALSYGSHLLYLAAEHTHDFVAHGFLACFAEMDSDLVGGLADLLHKGGLFGSCGCGSDVFGIHRDSFPARDAPVEQ